MKQILIIAYIIVGFCTQLTAKERIVERPPFLAWSSTSIEIDKIALSDTATVLHIKAFYTPKNWIKIASGSFLKGNDGELYRLRQGVGITPDQEFWMPESGEAEFKLIFPALPANVTSIDFSEGDFDGSFQIWGIQLKGKLPKLNIPKNSIAPKPDQKAALPEPALKYGKAVLNGKIIDYRKGMPEKAMIYIGSPFKGNSGPQNIEIKEDGSFQVETDAPCTAPVAFYYLGTRIGIFISPEEETSVLINPRELVRSESHLHKSTKPDGKKIYFSGFMSGLQQELNDTDLSIYTLNFDQVLKDILNKTPDEYKSYIIAETRKREELINNSKLSQACRELLITNLAFNVMDYLFSTSYYLPQAYIQANGLKREEAQKYFREANILLPDGYYNVLKDFPQINTPQAFYSISLNYAMNYMQRLSKEEAVKMLGTDKGVLFDLLPVLALYKQISDFNPLTEAQKQELSQLASPAYAAILEKENEKVAAQIDLNKKKTGFRVNETGEVSNEDLFASIISKFQGHTLLVDFWATWCGPCRMANKAMIPMKEELKDKDIVYLYLTGETSPKGTWENMITDIHGEHFRVTNDQWGYLMNAFKIQGVPTYFVIDAEGNITFKTTGFPGDQKIKEELLKAMERK